MRPPITNVMTTLVLDDWINHDGLNAAIKFHVSNLITKQKPSLLVLCFSTAQHIYMSVWVKYFGKRAFTLGIGVDKLENAVCGIKYLAAKQHL